MGGYLNLFSFDFLVNIFYIFNIDFFKSFFSEINVSFFSILLEGLISSLMLGLKSCLMIFIFIWASASLPRIRFDQLMSYCWTVLLPVIIALIIVIPCVVYTLSLLPANFYLI